MGTPSATTVATGTNTTQIATTACVKNQAYATLASPALSGTRTAPTPSQGTNSTQIATTAFVKSQQIPISIGWIAGQNPNNAIVSVINQPMTVRAIVGAAEVANDTTATVMVNQAPSGVGLFRRERAPFRQFQRERHRSGGPPFDGYDTELDADDRICLQTTGGTDWNSGAAVGTITTFVTPS
jgi:hypothetical protein